MQLFVLFCCVFFCFVQAPTTSYSMSHNSNRSQFKQIAVLYGGQQRGLLLHGMIRVPNIS